MFTNRLTILVSIVLLVSAMTLTRPAWPETVTVDAQPQLINFHQNLPLLFHSVKVTPRGHSVEFSFGTKEPTVAIVKVASKPAKTGLPLFGSNQMIEPFSAGDIVGENAANLVFPAAKMSHTIQVPPLPLGEFLQPQKSLFYAIMAVTQGGKWYYSTGNFTTLQRKAQVTFKQVHVIDDSDELSAGDLAFGFFINGENAPNGNQLTFGPVSISTGGKKSFTRSGSVKPAPGFIVLKAIGYDDDEMESPFELQTCGLAAPNHNVEGADKCGEWTVDTILLDLAELAKEASNPEDFSRPFTIKVRPKIGKSELKFDVSGTVRVTFAP